VRKHIFTVIISLIVATVILLGLEAFARIFKYFGPSSFRFRQFDQQLGVSLVPGRQGVHRRCYDGYVYVNGHGMRDRERQTEKAEDIFRISVFSDSVLEAVHVKPEETALFLLEEKLSTAFEERNIEVLNFSVGGYSTYQEYLRYMKDGKVFKSDLVLIVFTDNDLQANLEDTVESVGNVYPTPYLKRINDQVQRNKSKTSYQTTATENTDNRVMRRVDNHILFYD